MIARFNPSSKSAFRVIGTAWVAIVLPAAAPPACAATPQTPESRQSVTVGTRELLVIAERLSKAGDLDNAEAAYRALARDPSLEVRSEARFRLAMLLIKAKRLSDAALLLRQILDETPGAQRVRLELAHVLDLMGDDAGARKALREAQAGGLPPDVARLVDRYSAALRAQKPLGASLEVALAPDSNINRATRSDTLGTVIGDFTLDEEARQRSGIGLALRGQVYARLPVAKQASLLARLSGAGDFYGHGEFNDLSLGLSAGPEFRLGSDRLAAEAGINRRWFGGEPFATTLTASLNYLHPLGRTAQMRVATAAGIIENERNSLQDGQSLSASLSYERALSSRAGIGVALSGDRQALRDPGYSTTGGQLTLFGYREIGSATLIGTLGFGHLEADARLAIFPRRRTENLYRGSLALNFRKLRFGSFSPFIRVTGERNRSSIEIYDYRRVRTEIGITRAY